jgi:hypothetical protein
VDEREDPSAVRPTQQPSCHGTTVAA